MLQRFQLGTASHLYAIHHLLPVSHFPVLMITRAWVPIFANSPTTERLGLASRITKRCATQRINRKFTSVVQYTYVLLILNKYFICRNMPPHAQVIRVLRQAGQAVVGTVPTEIGSPLPPETAAKTKEIESTAFPDCESNLICFFLVLSWVHCMYQMYQMYQM